MPCNNVISSALASHPTIRCPLSGANSSLMSRLLLAEDKRVHTTMLSKTCQQIARLTETTAVCPAVPTPRTCLTLACMWAWRGTWHVVQIKPIIRLFLSCLLSDPSPNPSHAQIGVFLRKLVRRTSILSQVSRDTKGRVFASLYTGVHTWQGAQRRPAEVA